VEVREIAAGNLTGLQTTVGGYIERLTLTDPAPLTLIVWEEAALYGAPVNPRASQLAQRQLRGDVAVFGPARRNELTDVPAAFRVGVATPPRGASPPPRSGPPDGSGPARPSAPRRRGPRPRSGQMVSDGGHHELATSLSDNIIGVWTEVNPGVPPVAVLRLNAAWMHTVATSHLSTADLDHLLDALHDARDTLRSTSPDPDEGDAAAAGYPGPFEEYLHGGPRWQAGEYVRMLRLSPDEWTKVYPGSRVARWAGAAAALGLVTPADGGRHTLTVNGLALARDLIDALAAGRRWHPPTAHDTRRLAEPDGRSTS
jgi:hypothetical protein